MANPAIISLAILKVNWDEQKRDYLQTFVPMVAECIRLSASDVVSIPEVRNDVQARFALTLPHNVLDRILRRLKRAGYVAVTKQGMYEPKRDRLADLDFQGVRQEALAKHQAVVDSLVKFQSERYAVKWTEEEAEAALLSYLDTYQLGFISAATRGQAVPPVRERRRGTRFILGAFVQHLQERESPDFSYLETVAQGNMLAQAVFLPDPERPQRRFRGTQVFLDTTFLINALGYNGAAREAPCVELLELLYRAGADLRCFKHTVDETRGVLQFCASTMARGKFDEHYSTSTEHFLQTGQSASDVELYATQIEKDLSRLRVAVVDKPGYGPPDKYKHVIGESDLTDVLGDRIRYPRERPLARDVESISAIMRLREGRRTSLYEESRALFVTTNAALADACDEYFFDEDVRDAIPPCVTDRDLTTMLWLKMPLRAPDLTRKRIIADCYAAMQPEPRLWHRYLAEIEKLEKLGRYGPDDVLLLRHSLDARYALMQVTVGEEGAFAQGTVPEILALARARIRGDLQSELESERREKEAARTEAAGFRRLEAERRAHVQERARLYAALLGRLVTYLALALVLVGAVASFPWALPAFRASGLRYVLSTMQVGLALAYVSNIVWGTTVARCVRALEIAFAGWLESRLLGLVE